MRRIGPVLSACPPGIVKEKNIGGLVLHTLGKLGRVCQTYAWCFAALLRKQTADSMHVRGECWVAKRPRPSTATLVGGDVDQTFVAQHC